MFCSEFTCNGENKGGERGEDFRILEKVINNKEFYKQQENKGDFFSLSLLFYANYFIVINDCAMSGKTTCL